MIDGNSLNVTEERIRALKALMPDVFSENKIDWDRLRLALGEDVFVANERYELSWAGKSDARREIQRTTTDTIIPDRQASIEFDASDNIFIEGDNLQALRILQRSYFGKIKMAYIDPPYNTGTDSFIYPDDFSEPLSDYQRRTGQIDAEGYLDKQDFWRQNKRESGQFHSIWLNMMYPRLFAARNLLSEDGVLFVSIDDNEVSNLKTLLDEVFGEENFIACICWQKKYAPANDAIDFSPTHDYVLVYTKNRQRSDSGKILATINRLERSSDQNKAYKNPDNDKRGVWKTGDYTCNKSAEQRPNLYYAITNPLTGETVLPNKNAVWRYSEERHRRNIDEDRVWWGVDGRNRVPAYKRFLTEVPDIIAQTWWSHEDSGHNDEAKKEFQKLFPEAETVFDTPKPTRLIKKMMQLGMGQDDMILDFFAGSATTAQAVLEQNAEDGGNRSFIAIQFDEKVDPKSAAYKAGYHTVADIARERIRRVIKKIHDQSAELKQTIGDIDQLVAKKTAELVTLRANSHPEMFADNSIVFQKPIGEINKLKAKREDLESQRERIDQTAKNFRAYKLGSSNFNLWKSGPIDKQAIGQLLFNFAQSDKPGANSESMLVEFMLKAGFSLSTSVECLDFDGIPVYSVDKGRMLVLLDGYNSAINGLIWKSIPQRVVCLDRLFAGQDEVLANLHLELRDRGIDFTVI